MSSTIEQDVIQALYQSDWTGSDSALAATAFRQGAESILEAVSMQLADMPATYESAISEIQWREKLAQSIYKTIYQGEMLDDFYSSR